MRPLLRSRKPIILAATGVRKLRHRYRRPDEVSLRSLEDAGLDAIYEQMKDPEAARMAASPSTIRPIVTPLSSMRRDLDQGCPDREAGCVIDALRLMLSPEPPGIDDQREREELGSNLRQGPLFSTAGVGFEPTEA